MKAIIRAKRLTEYATIVEMSQDDFRVYQEALHGGGPTAKSAEKQLNMKIKQDDWQDETLEELEFEEFEDESSTPNTP